jgi:hypothetical protein
MATPNIDSGRQESFTIIKKLDAWIRGKFMSRDGQPPPPASTNGNRTQFHEFISDTLNNSEGNSIEHWQSKGKEAGGSSHETKPYKEWIAAAFDMEISQYKAKTALLECELNSDAANAELGVLREKQTALAEEIETRKNELARFQERINLEKSIVDQFHKRVHKTWEDHDQFIGQLNSKHVELILSKSEQLTAIEKTLKQYREALLKIQEEIKEASDIDARINSRKKKAHIDQIIKAERQRLSTIEEEKQKLNDSYINFIEKVHTIPKQISQDFNEAITVPEAEDSQKPKNWFYLIALFVGFIVATSAEVAIMNRYTGDILGVGTIPDKFSDFLDLFLQDRGDPLIWGTLLDLLFLIPFSLIPYALSFLIKFCFDRYGDRAKKPFLYIALPMVILYIFSVALTTVITSDTTASTDFLLGDGSRGVAAMSWAHGLVLVCISLSMLLVGGWLLYHFFREFENLRRVNANKSEARQAQEEITQLQDQLAGVTTQIDQKEQKIDEQNRILQSLEGGIDIIEAKKNEAIEAFKVGYEHGRREKYGFHNGNVKFKKEFTGPE